MKQTDCKNQKATPPFVAAHILLPADGTDIQKWAVVACDQFTSQPDYWQSVATIAGKSPSTLNIILPEVFLGDVQEADKIKDIHATMQSYLQNVLTKQVQGFVYVRRQMQNGAMREGLIGCVDLEQYSYVRGETPAIRPSEGTIVDRIPPRLAVRKGAQLESPHILMLIDDVSHSVIEPFAARTGQLASLYDFELMLGGGHVQGWAVEKPADIETVLAAMQQLETAESFYTRYGIKDRNMTVPFTIAAGDGNHSLATAKAYWDECRQSLSDEEKQSHPARFCLVELENIQSAAIEIEPIHRVVFGVPEKSLSDYISKKAKEAGIVFSTSVTHQEFTLIGKNADSKYYIQSSPAPLAVGTLELLFADIAADFTASEVDYIHGEDNVRQLVALKDAVGFILPDFEKGDLFKGVALGGVLPKKTFSMGHPEEKRYYLECKKITK